MTILYESHAVVPLNLIDHGDALYLILLQILLLNNNQPLFNNNNDNNGANDTSILHELHSVVHNKISSAIINVISSASTVAYDVTDKAHYTTTMKIHIISLSVVANETSCADIVILLFDVTTKTTPYEWDTDGKTAATIMNSCSSSSSLYHLLYNNNENKVNNKLYCSHYDTTTLPNQLVMIHVAG